MDTHVFKAYWNAYANIGEANDTDKTAWSRKSISGKIVPAAIQCVGSILGEIAGDGRRPSTIADNVWEIDGSFVFRGVRASVLGIEEVNAQAFATLIREAGDRCREAICFCVLPSSEHSIWPAGGSGEPYLSLGGAVPLYPRDIDALTGRHVDLPELLEYKLVRRFVLEKPDPEAQFHSRLIAEFRDAKKSGRHSRMSPLADTMSGLGEDHRSWIQHPLIERVCGELDRRRGCLLIGPSSSGKTVLALQAGYSFHLAGQDVRHLNLGMIGAPPHDIVNTFLLSQGTPVPFLIIADDLQSNPAIARYILAVASIAQRSAVTSAPVVLAAAWPDFAADATLWYENCVPLAVRAHQVRSKLTRQFTGILPESTIRGVSERLGDDLLLLRLALERSQQLGQQTGLADLARAVWEARIEGSGVAEADTKRAGLVAASLGRFDIPVSRAFLRQESQVSDRNIDALLATHLFRRERDKLTMGHRSLCGLIANWLETQGAWQELQSVKGPANTAIVVLDHLRSLGSSLAVDTLVALHARAGFKEKPKLNRRAATIVEIWQAFNAVVERIQQQQLKDATWGRAASSAMFAVKAFAELGKPRLAEKSLEFLRACWKPGANGFEVLTTDLSTCQDFEQIQRTMREEDDLDKTSGVMPWRPATDVDIDLFHRTWLMGVILCAETAARHPCMPLPTLGTLAEAHQLPSGAFYPERVPWCSARVLLGLAACGHTIDTSPSVRRCVDWLLRDRSEDGPCRSSLWPSGTGTWNSELETTSMVLLALAASGHDCSDERLVTARSFILSERAKWTTSGKELDGALAIQAYLDTGGEWEEVAHETQFLSQWAKGQAVWLGATRSAKESLDQSCRVAQIACHLVSIGWAAVRSDLPAFLDALVTPDIFKHEMSAQASAALVPAVGVGSPPTTPPGELACKADRDMFLDTLGGMVRVSLTECTVVGRYRRFDERIRNRLRDWKNRILQPLAHKTDAHENFLIWADPGSGKSFLIEEIAASVAGTIGFVQLNLAKQTRGEYDAALQSVAQASGNMLCLVDEIDARPDESWPYDDLFSLLDLNRTSNRALVFVLVGSTPTGLHNMVQKMLPRYKGKDLLDRVPEDRRFEIPKLTVEDQVAIFGSQVVDAAKKRGQIINEIEKLALYYVLRNRERFTPRQLADLAITAVQRIPHGELRLKYDDLFFRGDNRNQLFWVENQKVAEEVSSVFIRIEA